jgi:hypothetical protein
MRQVHSLLVGTALGVLATVAAASFPEAIRPRTATRSRPPSRKARSSSTARPTPWAANFLTEDFAALYPGIPVESTT